MTNNINSQDKFRQISILQLRQILRGLASESDIRSIGAHSKVHMSEGGVLAVINECLEENLLEQIDKPPFHSYGLTNAGCAIAEATARKRSPKETGRRILNSIIHNAAELNSNPNSLFVVDKIWVFGSYINPQKDDIGDLDIAFEISNTDNYPDNALNRDYYRKHFPELKIENVGNFWQMPKKFIQRSLFGSKRNSLISESPIYELIELHAPCALVYDRAVGAIENIQVLPHHPSSAQRGDNIFERNIIPTFSDPLKEFTPTNANILSEHLRKNRGDAQAAIYCDKLPKSLSTILPSQPKLDPQNRFAVGFRRFDYELEPFVAFIERDADTTGDAWNYKCKVSVQVCGNALPDTLNDEHKFALAEIVQLCVDADMHRLAWLRRDLNPFASIDIDVEVNLNDDIFPEFRDVIHARTQSIIDDDTNTQAVDMFYGIMILGDDDSGRGLGHLLEMSEEELDALPSDFPLSKDVIMAHKSYSPFPYDDNQPAY